MNFTMNCELCGAAVYEKNYVIYNVKTKAKCKIGSDCIKRFVPSHNYFKTQHPRRMHSLKRKHKQQQLGLKVRDIYNLMCNQGRPEEELFYLFRIDLIRLLKSYKKMSLLKTKSGTIKVLEKLLKRTNYTEYEVRRLQLLVRNPKEAARIHVKDSRRPRKKIDKYGIVIG